MATLCILLCGLSSLPPALERFLDSFLVKLFSDFQWPSLALDLWRGPALGILVMVMVFITSREAPMARRVL